ncbi:MULTISPECIES: FAD-binding oxidoreductase [unclassified Leifsonia]|uniref:FAD-binding oxidoreductase n=1 Tax=unclassified Leifsonia TaxID=2663824 RepID=UPI0006F65103|nr:MULTISPECIES: FAD-binding oxidoreductase [unclassified Leifsonia]KQX06968.1 FAD-linked oxidase [Leifsonia sp. Root1293]KRA11252.1 FAD-linked oxidase [Leifsonia sp. Root60]
MAASSLSDTSVEGQVVFPTDPDYDNVRTVWNAMVDHRPQVIVRCASVADVQTAVRAAREHDLEIGIRCGGHSVLGLGVPEGGLMIDLTPLGGVRVDPACRRARVQGGALLGALDRASQAHGLATTAGNVSHTGVGGLTLGGGMGWLARQYGLSCDNVRSFEVVTADGETVTASSDENPDLFWGLRGGGGNFGIVTSFEFELHEVGTRALSVELDFARENAAEVLARWRDLSAGAPRQATFSATLMGDIVTVGFVWVGDADQGNAYARELADLGHPIAERIDELSYVDLQRRDDTIRGHAQRRYWKGHYFRELPDAAFDALLEHDPEVGASLQAYGGAIGDVPDNETAFSQRDTLFEYVAGTRWTDPGEDGDRIERARLSAARLAPFASGVYVNVLTDEGAAGIRAAYPPAKLARLGTLKAAWDPSNVFHLNQNILPVP